MTKSSLILANLSRPQAASRAESELAGDGLGSKFLNSQAHAPHPPHTHAHDEYEGLAGIGISAHWVGCVGSDLDLADEFDAESLRESDGPSLHSVRNVELVDSDKKRPALRHHLRSIRIGQVVSKKTHTQEKVMPHGLKTECDGKHRINPDETLCLGSPLRLMMLVHAEPTLSGFASNCIVPYLYSD
jgi:hypothetical protein